MKIFLIFLLVIGITSCNHKTKSEVKPFAKAQKLDDQYGDKIKLKIPLTESSLGYFDVEDVLGNKNLDSTEKSTLNTIKDNFKLALYRLTVGFGFSNKIKYSTDYDFGHINPDFLKSAKITKVFFTTEDCRKEDKNCNNKLSKKSNFDFVDRLFINLSNFKKEEGEEDFQVVKDDEFEKVAKQSFNQTKVEAKEALKAFAKDDAASTNDTIEFKEINLVRFENKVPTIAISEEEIQNSMVTDTKFLIEEEDTPRKRIIKKYLLTKEYKDIVKKVKKNSKGVLVILKDNVKPQELVDRINSFQSPSNQKMFIFRLNSQFVEVKKYFMSKRFEGLVADSTMIGKSLFVELNDTSQMKEFKEFIASDEFQRNNFDVLKIESCKNSNCLDLDITDVNLVPLLLKNPKLKIDSYISVRALGASDFKYNGFIEIEVDISLPL